MVNLAVQGRQEELIEGGQLSQSQHGVYDVPNNEIGTNQAQVGTMHQGYVAAQPMAEEYYATPQLGGQEEQVVNAVDDQ